MTQFDAPRGLRGSKWKLIRLIGPVLLVILLVNMDLDRLWTSLAKLTTIQIASAGSAVLALLLIRCERWHRLLGTAGIRLNRCFTYPSCMRSIWIGYITPGRIGEFNRGLDLVRRQVARPGAAWALVLIDLSGDAIIALGIAAVAILTAYATATSIITFSGGFWVSAVLVIIVAFSVRPMLSTLSVLSARVRYLETITDTLARLAQARRRDLLVLLFLTIVSNVLYVAMMVPLFRPIDGTLDLANTAVIVMIAAVAGMIPITYFGLGTRETAILLVLGQTGRSSELAIALSLTFIVAMAIGLLVAAILDVIFSILRSSKSNCSADRAGDQDSK